MARQPNGLNSPWTKEMEEYLKTCNGNHRLSYPLIVDQLFQRFGVKFRISQVAGKLGRLKIKLNKSCNTRNQQYKFAEPPNMKTTPIPSIDVEGLESKGVKLLDLGDTDCRWPVGDLFCGNQTYGLKYCPVHSRKSSLPRDPGTKSLFRLPRS